MEVIFVLVIAVVAVAVVVAGLGSALGRSRGTDELQAERGADASPHQGMGSTPIRDRPAGPGAEAQGPGTAGGELHPPEQRGGGTDEAAPPSEAAGKQDPEEGDERP